jgi:phosphatidylserine/phosphatidylglycerophosphate/cardiolipin synthase-like enzyme
LKGKWIYLFWGVLLACGCGDVADRIGRSPFPELTEETPLPTQPSSLPAEPINVYFSQVDGTVSANRANPQNIALRCANVIDAAQRTLDVCCHEISNATIVDAIVRAYRRGVTVRVVAESDYGDDAGCRKLRREGVPLLLDTRSALMHNKFIVVDRSAVWTGSFNFTDNCAYKNNNNAVLLINRQIAANYSEKFRWFWEEGKFGGKPSRFHYIPYPVVTVNESTVIENYFSTHGNVDKKIINALRNAKESIEFLAFSFTHGDIARVMLERADRGVKVSGVFESRQNSKYSEFDRLDAHPAVNVLTDGNKYNMHHKAIIIDRRTVITGSYNFSTSATSVNDENVVIIHDVKTAEAFRGEFERVFAEAQNAIAGLNGGLLRR